MTSKYYISTGPGADDIGGPYTSEELQAMIQAGHLDPGNLAVAEGAQEWRPLAQWPDFSSPQPRPERITTPQLTNSVSPTARKLRKSAHGSNVAGCLLLLIFGPAAFFGLFGMVGAFSEPSTAGGGALLLLLAIPALVICAAAARLTGKMVYECATCGTPTNKQASQCPGCGATFRRA
jgi:hypothetical protein